MMDKKIVVIVLFLLPISQILAANVIVDTVKNTNVANIIGTNKPNSGNEGHSTSGNESNKGYSKYQKYNEKIGEFITEIEKDKDFHNVDEIRKVNGKDTNSKTSQKLKEIKDKIFSKKEGER